MTRPDVTLPNLFCQMGECEIVTPIFCTAIHFPPPFPPKPLAFSFLLTELGWDCVLAQKNAGATVHLQAL